MTDPAPTLGEVLADDAEAFRALKALDSPALALAVELSHDRLHDSLHGITQPDGSRTGGLVERVEARAVRLKFADPEPRGATNDCLLAALREEIGETDG